MAFIYTPDGISIELQARAALPPAEPWTSMHAQHRFLIEPEAPWRGDSLARRGISSSRAVTACHAKVAIARIAVSAHTACRFCARATVFTVYAIGTPFRRVATAGEAWTAVQSMKQVGAAHIRVYRRGRVIEPAELDRLVRREEHRAIRQRG
jgi:hypothetical protein